MPILPITYDKQTHTSPYFIMDELQQQLWNKIIDYNNFYEN